MRRITNLFAALITLGFLAALAAGCSDDNNGSRARSACRSICETKESCSTVADKQECVTECTADHRTRVDAYGYGCGGANIDYNKCLGEQTCAQLGSSAGCEAEQQALAEACVPQPGGNDGGTDDGGTNDGGINDGGINDGGGDDGGHTNDCNAGEFQCPSGNCISSSWICDGDNDCGDMSDEQNCGGDNDGGYDSGYDGGHDSGDCGPDDFICDNGECLIREVICNGTNDCSDGSDEWDCDQTCAEDAYPCPNNPGICVTMDMICDGNNDCGDGSDEQEAICGGDTCNADQFTCDNGNCVSSDWICDGDNDCGDLSDEQNCGSQTCSSTEFTCDNGNCIPDSWICDGDNDCGDLSDEQNCG